MHGWSDVAVKFMRSSSFRMAHRGGAEGQLRALRIILAPRRQERQVRIHFFLCGPFDVAQDMLCAFARDISAFGCGSAALGLGGECFFTGNPE